MSIIHSSICICIELETRRLCVTLYRRHSPKICLQKRTSLIGQEYSSRGIISMNIDSIVLQISLQQTEQQEKQHIICRLLSAPTINNRARAKTKKEIVTSVCEDNKNRDLFRKRQQKAINKRTSTSPQVKRSGYCAIAKQVERMEPVQEAGELCDYHDRQMYFQQSLRICHQISSSENGICTHKHAIAENRIQYEPRYTGLRNLFF